MPLPQEDVQPQDWYCCLDAGKGTESVQGCQGRRSCKCWSSFSSQQVPGSPTFILTGLPAIDRLRQEMDQKTDQVCNSMAEAAPLGMCCRVLQCRVLQGLGVLQSFAIFQGVFCKVNTESNWCFGDMFFCWIPSVAIYHSVSLSPWSTKPCFAIACFALWAMLFRKEEKIHFLRSTRLFNQFHQLILWLILFISFTPFGYIVFQWDLYFFKTTNSPGFGTPLSDFESLGTSWRGPSKVWIG